MTDPAGQPTIRHAQAFFDEAIADHMVERRLPAEADPCVPATAEAIWRHGYDVGFNHGKGDDGDGFEKGNGYEPIFEEFGPNEIAPATAVSVLEAEVRGLRAAAAIALDACGYDHEDVSYRAIMKRVAASTDEEEADGGDPMADVTKRDWEDAVFCRHYIPDLPTWLVKNAVQGQLGHHFDTEADAQAWIAKELPYRSEIERWARVLDKTLWAAFDKDERARDGTGQDENFESLRNAIRVHAALGGVTP